MTWQSLNRYSRGHKRDPQGIKRTSFGVLSMFTKGTAGLLGASLVSFAPPVFDQGQLGSCCGHSYACAVTTALAAAGTPLGFVASPGSAYKIGRCIDRTTLTDPLTDSGCEPNAMCRAISEWGVCAMGPQVQDPGDPAPRFSDCSQDNVNIEPTLEELETDAKHLVIGEYAIDATGSALFMALASAIDSRLPFTLSVPGGSDAWQMYTGGVVDAVPANQAELDHEVVCVGYRVSAAGAFEYEIRNSWGASYGESGNIWISEAAMAQCADYVAMKVTIQEAA